MAKSIDRMMRKAGNAQRSRAEAEPCPPQQSTVKSEGRVQLPDALPIRQRLPDQCCCQSQGRETQGEPFARTVIIKLEELGGEESQTEDRMEGKGEEDKRAAVQR